METSTVNLVLDQLNRMQIERREDHKELTAKVDEGFAAITKRADGIASDLALYKSQMAVGVAETDSRIARIEGVHKTAKWVVSSIFLGGLAVGWDFVKHHFMPWLKGA